MPARGFPSLERRLQAGPAADPGHRGTLLALLKAISNNELTALPNFFTPDAELRIHGFPAFNTHSRGREHVVTAVAAHFGRRARREAEAEQVIQDGSALAVLIRERGLLKDGRRYAGRGVIWCRFRHNRIHRLDEFLDTCFEDIAA